MYSTCLFCNENLGKNEVVEHFPIGRRLAFDAAKGRLWVVCRSCERWNLTPVEERWGAIEECERQFSETRVRVSTDNIGLAKLREGLELVRIGSALRPEMAAWRYGDQFGRRRRKHLIYTGVGISAIAGLVDGSRDGMDRRWRMGLVADHHEPARSEEHTSELQSQSNLVCRLLLEKKKKKKSN